LTWRSTSHRKKQILFKIKTHFPSSFCTNDNNTRNEESIDTNLITQQRELWSVQLTWPGKTQIKVKIVLSSSLWTGPCRGKEPAVEDSNVCFYIYTMFKRCGAPRRKSKWKKVLVARNRYTIIASHTHMGRVGLNRTRTQALHKPLICIR